MAEPQKPSSGWVYDAKWGIFRNWCTGRHTDPGMANIPELADFLCYIHEEKHLKMPTIEGYCAAISHVLKATRDLDVGHDPSLSNLLANFARDTSQIPHAVPPWNLALVLQSLSGSPF